MVAAITFKRLDGAVWFTSEGHRARRLAGVYLHTEVGPIRIGSVRSEHWLVERRVDLVFTVSRHGRFSLPICDPTTEAIREILRRFDTWYGQTASFRSMGPVWGAGARWGLPRVDAIVKA